MKEKKNFIYVIVEKDNITKENHCEVKFHGAFFNHSNAHSKFKEVVTNYFGYTEPYTGNVEEDFVQFTHKYDDDEFVSIYIEKILLSDETENKFQTIPASNGKCIFNKDTASLNEERLSHLKNNKFLKVSDFKDKESIDKCLDNAELQRIAHLTVFPDEFNIEENLKTIFDTYCSVNKMTLAAEIILNEYYKGCHYACFSDANDNLIVINNNINDVEIALDGSDIYVATDTYTSVMWKDDEAEVFVNETCDCLLKVKQFLNRKEDIEIIQALLNIVNS